MLSVATWTMRVVCAPTTSVPVPRLPDAVNLGSIEPGRCACRQAFRIIALCALRTGAVRDAHLVRHIVRYLSPAGNGGVCTWWLSVFDREMLRRPAGVSWRAYFGADLRDNAVWLRPHSIYSDWRIAVSCTCPVPVLLSGLGNLKQPHAGRACVLAILDRRELYYYGGVAARRE